MSWLAHVFLSKPDIEFRLGNLLADLVKGPDRASMSAAFQLPAEAQAAVERMMCDDRLGSYRRLDGIEASLRRVSKRLLAKSRRNPSKLATSSDTPRSSPKS